MLKEYKLQAVLGVWGGVSFFILGYSIAAMPSLVYLYFGRVIMAGGYILFVCGCFMYARGKGHAWPWGFLGFLGPLGLLFLYSLKDRSGVILKKRERGSH